MRTWDALARSSSTCVTQQVSSLIFVAPQIDAIVMSYNWKHPLSLCPSRLYSGVKEKMGLVHRALVFNRLRFIYELINVTTSRDKFTFPQRRNPRRFNHFPPQTFVNAEIFFNRCTTVLFSSDCQFTLGDVKNIINYIFLSNTFFWVFIEGDIYLYESIGV